MLGMFSLNSIGCVTCGPAGILEGNTATTDVCKAALTNLHTEGICDNILTAR